MKIVILMSALTMGGAERVAISLANYLSEKEEIYLISFDNQEPSYALNKKVHLFLNKEKIVNNRLKGFQQRLKFVKKTLKEIHPDVIFTMFYQTAAFALYYKYFSNNKKVVVISSERCNPLSADRGNFSKFLNEKISKHCDGFIFQTERVKKLYHPSIQKKSIVIHNPISNPLLKEISKDKVRTEKTITSMGRLTEQKAQDVMIRAFSKIASDFKDYKLVIYGEGELRPYLENLIKELNLNNQVLLPGASSSALIDVSKSQVFLLTSRFEGMPNALMEAMAVGIPSISTDCNFGPAELIENEKNGFLVKVDDEEEIASKLRLLLENEELRNQISLESKKIIETHSIPYIFDEYFSYFQTVAKKAKK